LRYDNVGLQDLSLFLELVFKPYEIKYTFSQKSP